MGSDGKDEVQHTPPFAFNWCFFLDIDGTLLEYVERPEFAQADAELRGLLGDLQFIAHGALALISGRSVADIDRMFAPEKYAVAGQHGIERRGHNGLLNIHPVPAAALKHALTVLKDLAAQHPGLVLENKGSTLALHFRLAPQLGPQVWQAMRTLCDELGEQFELLSGKLLYEIKPGGKHKGTAIAEFLEEPPFRDRVPIFIGDDVTDEAAFVLVNRLRGCSVKVGPGVTSAHWRLTDSNAVRDWLRVYCNRSPRVARAGRHAKAR